MNAQQQAVQTLRPTFGEYLFAGRIRAGLSQAELAAIVGVSQAAVGQWERDEFMPRGRHLNNLIDILDLDYKQAPDALAQQIRATRARVNLTQDELATKLGVSQQSVAKWELGTAAPRGQNRAALTNVLGLTFDGPVGEVQTVQPATIASELLQAELIIVTMYNALTVEQKGMMQAQLVEAGVSGSDAVRSQERRAAILAGGAA